MVFDGQKECELDCRMSKKIESLRLLIRDLTELVKALSGLALAVGTLARNPLTAMLLLIFVTK